MLSWKPPAVLEQVIVHCGADSGPQRGDHAARTQEQVADTRAVTPQVRVHLRTVGERILEQGVGTTRRSVAVPAPQIVKIPSVRQQAIARDRGGGTEEDDALMHMS